MYLKFSTNDLEEIMEKALSDIEDDLKDNHPWDNDTRELQDSIRQENLELHIEADHASYVDIATPYIDDTVDKIESTVIQNIELYLEGI